MADDRLGFLCKIRLGKGLTAKLTYVGVRIFPSTCFFKNLSRKSTQWPYPSPQPDSDFGSS